MVELRDRPIRFIVDGATGALVSYSPAHSERVLTAVDIPLPFLPASGVEDVRRPSLYANGGFGLQRFWLTVSPPTRLIHVLTQLYFFQEQLASVVQLHSWEHVLITFDDVAEFEDTYEIRILVFAEHRLQTIETLMRERGRLRSPLHLQRYNVATRHSNGAWYATGCTIDLVAQALRRLRGMGGLYPSLLPFNPANAATMRYLDKKEELTTVMRKRFADSKLVRQMGCRDDLPWVEGEEHWCFPLEVVWEMLEELQVVGMSAKDSGEAPSAAKRVIPYRARSRKS